MPSFLASRGFAAQRSRARALPLLNLAPVFHQWISIRETNCTIHWIVFYPLDSAIQLLNNWGLKEKRGRSQSSGFHVCFFKIEFAYQEAKKF